MTFCVAAVQTVNSKSHSCAPVKYLFDGIVTCVFRSSDDDRKLSAIEKELLDLLRRKVLVDKKLHAGKVRLVFNGLYDKFTILAHGH